MPTRSVKAGWIRRDTHLVEVGLELEVLESLLDERDERAGREVGARDGRLLNVGLVAEGVRRVREAALLEVAVDEVVDLVGGDGHGVPPGDAHW